jgi:hypothetical protein
MEGDDQYDQDGGLPFREAVQFCYASTILEGFLALCRYLTKDTFQCEKEKSSHDTTCG